MASCCEKNIEMFLKRDRTIRITVSGAGDLTGSKIWFAVKEDKDDSDDDAIIMKKSANNDGSADQADVVDGPGGVIEVYIKPEDTSAIDPGVYIYGVAIETSSGRLLQVVDPSKISFKKSVPMT